MELFPDVSLREFSFHGAGRRSDAAEMKWRTHQLTGRKRKPQMRGSSFVRGSAVFMHDCLVWDTRLRDDCEEMPKNQ